MDEGSQQAVDILKEYVGTIFARCIVRLSTNRAGLTFDGLDRCKTNRLLAELDFGLRNYIKDSTKRDECRDRLVGLIRQRGATDDAPAVPSTTLVEIKEEADIVRARSAGRQLCQALGFPTTIQIRVATAISELARNIVQYVGRGSIEVRSITVPQPGIEVVAIDHGPGIAQLDSILDGSYHSKSGMGLGLLGAKRLMDHFEINTDPVRGTKIVIRKYTGR